MPDKPNDNDERADWITSAKYFAVSVVMVTLAISAYTFYVAQRHTELAAQSHLAQELQTSIEKEDRVEAALTATNELKGKIQNLQIDQNQKDELLGNARSIEDNLNEVKELISSLQKKIHEFGGTQGSRNSSTGEIDAVFASLDPGTQVTFAYIGFGLLFLFMCYCALMIGLPQFSAEDKKWAKDLLKTQIGFVGGILTGIVIKYFVPLRLHGALLKRTGRLALLVT